MSAAAAIHRERLVGPTGHVSQRRESRGHLRCCLSRPRPVAGDALVQGVVVVCRQRIPAASGVRATAPHLAVWPGLALTVTVYSLNGDAVRDLLDLRLTGGAGRLGAQDTKSV